LNVTSENEVFTAQEHPARMTCPQKKENKIGKPKELNREKGVDEEE
jgi:hypothetical protein